MLLTRIFSLLGPGIVWAATSIGVSHIVQSTRAGADFGFALLGFILLAHVIKYPFFLFGPTYASTTGKSLLDGYKDVGNWAFYLFLLLTFITMFFVQAGVTIVTSALALNLFGDLLSLSQWASFILFTVIVILIIGRYALLNRLLKWMMLILAVFSVLAWLAAISRLGFTPASAINTSDMFNTLTAATSIAFIVALMGWMPTSLEVSVWHSLWTLSRKQSGKLIGVTDATLDFKIGYLTSFILAIIFTWLGALLMFGQGVSFANSAAAFASQLVSIYSSALGEWSWSLMAVITFIALFSTTFAVSDGFPQVWKRAYVIHQSNKVTPINHSQEANADRVNVISNRVYVSSLLMLAIGGWWIIYDFTADIKALLDFVTTVSFVSAPIYAWLNYKVITSSKVPLAHQPTGVFKWYTLSSLSLLTIFSGYFLYWRFG
ncbi:NRAMP family divalent metal transporter [Flocculibacter collagenilyticus]|uniref:NRAMP family divalent metal transporter n=1 Tax=Flocculibacter collagenilyticus TaxID=2744479 RepID=UPI0018F6A422|nr:divalent metal cation transporter [Flocculibacter collagenilyticus]